MGKVKIAQTLARAGLHLGTTTVGRMLKGGEDAADLSPAPSADCGPEASTETIDITADDHDGLGKSRVVTANRPNHVWHVDLTSVPTAAGFCTTWLPFALPQSWPFCWWVAVAIDHFSRRVMGIAAFPRQPTSVAVRTFLGRAIAKAGTAPKYLVCDRGSQFDCQGFRGWCERSGIKPPRYGAIGRGTRLRVAGASPWLNASS
jgi:transposase InsO family protein